MSVPPPYSNDDPKLPRPSAKFEDLPDSYSYRMETAKLQARKWFAILLGSGLLVGTLLAFGVVKAIEHFGLVDRPDGPLRFEQRQR